MPKTMDSRRGSEWLRWDVHIHAPGTACNNQFPADSWGEYISRINEAKPEAVALGITDYLSISGYREVHKQWRAGALPNVRFVFPNIEFRISPPTRKHKGVNFHLLLDPTDADHIERIEEALSRLTFTYNNEVFNCAHASLERLGRAVDSRISDSRKAYELGVNEFKIDFSRFRTWLQEDIWLRKRSLVAVSNNEGDGVAGLAKGHGYEATIEEMYRMADVVFSGNPSDREYWLGHGAHNVTQLSEKFGGAKPCLHGSDAHSLKQVLNPDKDRFCWIRAEPTFNGLRQVVFEPEARVSVGPTQPGRARQNWITDLRVNNAEWFPQSTIQLNEGLITIIGPRGSGKTALADLIAYGGNAFDSGPASFLAKAGMLAHGTRVELHWADGDVNQAEVGDNLQDHPAIRYLSQHFVEQLCSSDGASQRLVHSIEEVVFDNLDDTERGEASSFGELRDSLTWSSEHRIQDLRNAIASSSEEVSRLQLEKATLPAKKRDLETVVKRLAQIDKDRVKYKVKGKDKKLAGLEKLQRELRSVEERLGRFKKQLSALLELKLDLEHQSDKNDHAFSTITSRLREIGVSDDHWDTFRLRFSGDVYSVLDRHKKTLDTHIKALAEGPPPKDVKLPLMLLKQEIEKLRRAIGLDTKRERQWAELERKRKSELLTKHRLEVEIRKTTNASTASAHNTRLQNYAKVFQEYARQRAQLETLYKPLSERLSDAPPERRQLEVVVRQSVNIRLWAERGAELVDFRKRTEGLWFRNARELEIETEALLGNAWRSGDVASIKRGIDTLVERFKTVKDYLVSGVTLADFASWLFSTDHVTVHYAIRYEGIDIERLSPGTRGIVLLILYLSLDSNDDRPLIIDQPEENLDPQSVFSVLTGYFRDVRRRRQVVIVTHNPNLVVNTDSDQVIVASSKRVKPGQLPVFYYESGGLENPDIRGRVCSILEGGAEAFQNRERRYGFR